MPHFITANNGHILRAGRALDYTDPDRTAWAASLVASGWPPLAAWLHAVKGWPAVLAKAYSLLGTDAWLVIDRDTALAAGRARKLIA